MTTKPDQAAVADRLPNGPAAACFLAGGIGSAALGFATVLTEMSTGVKQSLNWWNPAGPLTGKTGVAVAVFFMSWLLLAVMWKGKDVDFRKVSLWTVILVSVGIVLTFPPVFLRFAVH